jgi:hypothetical protein
MDELPPDSIEIVSSILIEEKPEPAPVRTVVGFWTPCLIRPAVDYGAGDWQDFVSSMGLSSWKPAEPYIPTRSERIRWYISNKLEGLSEWIMRRVERLRSM